MKETPDTFESCLRRLDQALSVVGSPGDVQPIAAEFEGLDLLPGFQLERQVEWLASKLHNDRFVGSGFVHEFLMAVLLNAPSLSEESWRTLSESALNAFPKLSDAADMVAVSECLAKQKPSAGALASLEHLLHETEPPKRAFVLDGLRMFLNRQDVPADQRVLAVTIADSVAPRRY